MSFMENYFMKRKSYCFGIFTIFARIGGIGSDTGRAGLHRANANIERAVTADKNSVNKMDIHCGALQLTITRREQDGKTNWDWAGAGGR